MIFQVLPYFREVINFSYFYLSKSRFDRVKQKVLYKFLFYDKSLCALFYLKDL